MVAVSEPQNMADMCQSICKVTYHNTCPDCGMVEDFTMDVPEFAKDILTGGNTQNYCDRCRERRDELERRSKMILRGKWLIEQADIPPNFMQWDKSIGNNELARSIRNNKNKMMLIAGANDTCKTRSAAYNLMLAAKEGMYCRFVTFSDLAAGYARTCKLASEKAVDYINDYLRFDILLIDDIGKRRITETAGEMLFDIVDKVYSGVSKTKLWITSNRAESMADMFADLDVGDATVSRLDRMIASGDMIKIEAK